MGRERRASSFARTWEHLCEQRRARNGIRIMASITYTSLDRDDTAEHGSLYWGIHDFLRQFVLVAIDLTENTAREMRFVPARADAQSIDGRY